jgi:hypothetical protein
MNNPPIYLSPKEASNYLAGKGIVFCSNRLRRLVDAGKLGRVVACKGRYFIPVSGLERYFCATDITKTKGTRK